MGIAENIKSLRAEHNLTQVEFGQIAGVSDKAVSTWEAGLKEPRMGAIKRIATHFGLSINDLISDTFVSTCISLAPSLTNHEQQLLALCRQLNEEGREKLLDYADDLVTSGKYIKNNPSLLEEKQA